MKTHFEVTAISSDKPNLERGTITGSSYIVEMTRQITPFQDRFGNCINILGEKPFIVHTHTPKGDSRDAC
jgi:hypothetical protein